MAINIFEGARRVSILVASLAAIGTMIGLYLYEPYISVDYSIAHPAGEFVKMEGYCPHDAASHYFSAWTSTGKKVSVDLCILAMSFGKDGKRLIPYKVDEEGMIWGGASYSSEITEYERKLAERFKMSLNDEILITKEITKRYRENVETGLGYLVVGLVIFWGFVWSIGWIVRGFLGIPRGMDKRPD